MSGALGADYKSGSQRARVVTESWGEHNLYCPNCSSPKLGRLAHNTQASDFSCPKCKFWFQLKGQKSRIGNSITDGAYEAMMRAIQRDEAPSYYFLHYEVVPFSPSGEKDGMRGRVEGNWVVRNLLLVPHFAFPPSAIVKRPALSATARRAGWIGCNFALNPESFRGWTLDVLNVVRRLKKIQFTNDDVYAFERELAALHPDNRHIRDKIRQQLQVLRDAGFLVQVERGLWRVRQ
jgi:type II restriction enzyme